MIATARLVDILNCEALAEQIFKASDRFLQRDTVVAPAAKIVNCADLRGIIECLKERADIVGMYVVAHLLTFVTVNAVDTILADGTRQISQEAVELGT